MEQPRQCHKPYTSQDKWIVSIMAGLLFLLIASPYLYSVISSLTSSVGVPTATEEGVPNLLGLLVHGLIFVLVVRLLMR